MSTVSRYKNLQKISFVSHSLGGLVARYAISKLYEQDTTCKISFKNGSVIGVETDNSCLEKSNSGKIAGLIPTNFITCATPHLGSRGRNQVTRSTYLCMFNFNNNPCSFFHYRFLDKFPWCF